MMGSATLSSTKMSATAAAAETDRAEITCGEAQPNCTPPQDRPTSSGTTARTRSAMPMKSIRCSDRAGRTLGTQRMKTAMIGTPSGRLT